MATFAADQHFWPLIHDLFDFTLTFEDVVMGIAPAALALLSAPWVARHVLRKERCIRANFLLWVKMLIAVGIFATDLMTLALRRSLPDSSTHTSLAATLLTALASVAVSAVIYAHHLRELQPSALSSTYVAVTMLLDAARSRSFLIRGGGTDHDSGLCSLGAVAAATAGLKLAMVLAEEVPKTALILRPSPHVGRESTSGLLSRLCFAWVNPLLARGFRRDDLAVDDIGGLGPEFAAELLHGEFSRRWRQSPATSGVGLAVVCFWCMPLAFLAIVVPQLCSTGFAFSQPFIMQKVIEGLQGSSSSSSDGPSSSLAATGNALIGATVVAFAGHALTNSYGKHMANRVLGRIRGALVTEIFAKCSRLSMSEAKRSSVLTLMTADIQGLAMGLAELFVIPLSLFQSGLGMYLLSLLIGYSFVLILVPVALSTLAGYLFGTSIASAWAAWNAAIDRRVAETSGVLSQLPAVKMQGLGPTVVTFLEGQRAEEMRVAKKFRVLQTGLSLVQLLIDIGTPSLLFAGALFWTGLGGEVNAKQVFPALAIVGMVQYPLSQSVAAYATVMTMVKSLGRIQEFLNTEENQDLRVVRAEGSDVLDEKKTPQLETESLETQLEKHQRVDALKSEDGGGPLVEFTSADIAPTGHDTAILRNVSFAAKPGSLTAVVGGVGSGKSTLLHSIIGEADIRKGTVSIDRKEPVGYCDQHVWLRNASIRDNIVGPGPFDQNRYDQAMRLCRLNEDVEQFPEGDGYIVGNNGCNLSGGQRHRLSLARSFYLNTRFMVLDDVFSALDHPTAIAIFSDLFGANGAARKEGRTVILATHLPECLTEADQILSLDGQGNVSVERGSRQEKQAQDLLEILQQPGEEDAGAAVSSDGSTEDALLAKTAGGVQRVSFSRVSRMGLYGLFIRSMGVWLFAVYLILQIMTSALEVLPDVYMRIWIEVAPKNKLYFIGYAGVALLCAVVGTLSYGFFYIIIVPRTSMSLHKAFSETFMRSTLSFVTKTDSGSILNKYSQDMTVLARALSALFSFCFYAFFGLVAQIAVILATSKWIAIAVAVLILGASALQYYYLRTSRQMRYLDLESHAPLYTQFLELSNGLRHIRAFGWEEELLAESFKLIDTSQRPFYTMYAIQQWLGFTLDCMSSILAIVMVTIATHLPQSTSQTALGLGFMHVITVGGTTCKLIEGWTKLETALGSLLRIYLFTIDTPVESQETVAKLPDVWPGAGKIEFEEVTARYNPDDYEKIALRNVSFAIAPGQKVGLRGRTGSGKSSIFLTLLRFLEYSGKILIDGVDVSTIGPDELRARLIIISQHSVKFSGTVRNNLLPFNMNEKDEEKIKERDQELQDELARLGLWEHVQEKGGLDAKLDDVGLSSGQLQMLCIARAILRYRDIRGKIVLVDEGTSNIDYETDAAIQKALKEAFADCTVITIAHRTNTIDDCDVQIELSKGNVVKKE